MLKSNKNKFFFQGLKLLLGSASKSIFWQYFNCVIIWNLIDFDIKKIVLFIKGVNLLLGSTLVP
jgi:hypothetical protein